MRQNYNRKAPRLAAQAGRHAHARQFRRMRKALRTLKGYTGRVLHDIGRKLGAIPEGGLRRQMEQRIALVTRLLRQTPKSAGKLYALHEPEVDCISKGKARIRYRFGCKVSIATTLAGGFVVGMRSMPGNSPPLPWSTVATAAIAPTARRCSSAARVAASRHACASSCSDAAPSSPRSAT